MQDVSGTMDLSIGRRSKIGRRSYKSGSIYSLRMRIKYGWRGLSEPSRVAKRECKGCTYIGELLRLLGIIIYEAIQRVIPF